MPRPFLLTLLALALVCALAAPPTGAADYPPGLMFSTVLNGVKLLPNNGQLRLDHIQAVFLPPAQSKTIYAYNPDDGGKLWAILSDQAGTPVARFSFYGQPLKEPYWLLNSYDLYDPKTGAKLPVDGLKPAPGNYVLDFFLDSGRFYTFPFSVSQVKSADPFQGGDSVYLEGAWSNWGYLFYTGANPEQSLVWKVWLRHKGVDSEKTVEVKVEVKRDADGKLICTSRPNTRQTLNQSWVRYEFDLIFPMEKTSGGAYFKAKDLLATDGAYTLKMTIDGADYGTWKFQVAGGKLNYTGRTVRGQADPLTFVEGGRDAWWYEKQK